MVRGERRLDHKRREILGASRALFVTEGYADTGMEVVARQAGVSTATLYAHFPSKEDLFRVTVDDLIAEAAENLGGGGPGESAKARLVAFAKSYAVFCASPATRAVLRLICAERRRFDHNAQVIEERLHDEVGGVIIRLITELAEAGDLTVEKPSWAASHLLGMIEHATLLYGLVRGDAAQPGRPMEAICEDAVVTFLARYGLKETGG